MIVLIMNEELNRYPRTNHIEDSRLGPGDDAKGRAKLASLARRWVVIEEKVDGANSGVSFIEDTLMLQSRGHYLAGGGRERQFTRFKAWAEAHEAALFEALGNRYVMYGEWMQARHTCFYDNIPHLFMEFDVYDRVNDSFLSTRARQELLQALPVVQVPVLYEGFAPKRLKDLKALVVRSACRTEEWRESLKAAAVRAGVDPEKAAAEADEDDAMEGLYIKVESGSKTIDRYKWVRHGFIQTISESGTHWAERPMIFNGLAPEVDLYAPEISWETPGLTGRDGAGGYKSWAQWAAEADEPAPIDATVKKGTKP